MKITAKPSSTNMGNIDVGSAQTSTFAPEKLERAKQLAAGVNPSLNITESDTYQDPQVNRIMKNRPRMALKTNASPERYLPPQESTEQDPGTISDTNGQANATIEATKPLSPQYAALKRQQRALQVKERELADKERALLASSSPQVNQDELVSRLKSQPLSVLQEHGVTYEQLTEAILTQQAQNPEIMALKAELQSLKEGLDRSLSDRDAAQENQALAVMQREAEQLVTQGSDFEMVRETQSVKDVMELIKRTYKATGEVIEVEEALRLVEDELVKDAEKIANIQKIRSRITSTAQEDQTLPLQYQKRMNTLTSRRDVVPVIDRKARAMAAFYGKKI